MSRAAGVVKASTDRSVLFLELDRPPLNVLDRPMLDALHDEVVRAGPDDALCALVIRGGGGRAFSAGVDLEDHRPEAARAMLHSVHRAILALLRAPVVTIAAVKGFCLGGGLELATACDLVIAEPDATFGQPEVKVGCFPPVACARLATLVGHTRAADLILTGQPISAERAAAIGLVARIGPVDRTLEEILGHVRALSRSVLRATVEAMRRCDVAALEAQLAENETIYERRLFASSDMTEGIEAFLEKRAPKWKHG
jgi:cyclohexa-1,5-dienecarbonyl-CoA hydratase